MYIYFIASSQILRRNLILYENFEKLSKIENSLTTCCLLAHPGKCYVKHTGIAHALGATWQVPEMLCAEATCYRSGSENKFLVAYQT